MTNHTANPKRNTSNKPTTITVGGSASGGLRTPVSGRSTPFPAPLVVPAAALQSKKTESSLRGYAHSNSFWSSLSSIRVSTSFLCALFIIVTAICLLVTTFKFSMDAAQDVAERQAVSIATKAKADVEGFLNKPLSSCLGWQFTLSNGDHKLPSDAEVANPLWYIKYWEDYTAAMRSSDWSYQFVTLGFDDGNYVACKNMPDDQFQCRLFHWGNRPANGSGTSALLQRDYYRNYTFIAESTSTTTYDPRTRGWYNYVNHTPFAMAWSTVYLSAIPTLPVMDLDVAFFNETGHFLGVGGVAFELGALVNFLADLVTTENTVSVLIDNEDLLLASSYSDPFLTSTDIPRPYTGTVPANCLVSDAANGATSSIMLCRAPVGSYSYAPLRELAAARPDVVAHGASGVLRIELSGVDYYVSVVPIETPLATNMHWRFALFVPQNDIVGGIIRGRDISIYISIGIVVGAVVLCFGILTLLMNPLQNVSDSMYKLATLQDTSVDSAKPSALFEIAMIQSAFRVMSEELTKVKSFLPQSVLAQLYGGPSDEEDDDEDLDFPSHLSQQIPVDSHGTQSEVCSMAMAPADCRSVQRQNLAAETASNIGGGSSNKKVIKRPALFTAMSLASRRVTMLSINIVSYHQHVIGVDATAVTVATTEIVSAISAAVNEHKGVLDGFQGDKFMASFNAVTAVGNHACAAAYAAFAANNSLANITVANGKPLRMTSGIASGPALVGNMGTQAVKRFTVLGHVVTTAGLLERLCKRYTDTFSLIGGNAVNETKHLFESLTCDVVTLPFNTNGPRRTAVASLRGVLCGSADEWMYELANANQSSRYGVINGAFNAFLDGEPAQAGAMLGRVREKLDNTDAPLVATVEYLTALLGNEVNGLAYVNTMCDFYSECLVTGAPAGVCAKVA